MRPEDIPKANTGITYNVSEVSEEDSLKFVQKLEEEVIVSKLQVTKRDSSVLLYF